MAEQLRGGAVSAALCAALAGRVAGLAARGTVPGLAVIQVGENAGDSAYARSAERLCGKVGVQYRHFALPADAGQEQLMRTVAAVNADDNLHGCLLLQPLPQGFDGDAARNAICPEKDVDGASDASRAALLCGGKGFAPCTPEGCLALLDYYDYSVAGKRAAVVGRSAVVGLPLALLLTARDATVTLCHSKTPDLAAVCRQADFVFAAAGRAGLIGADCLRAGQVLVDVGINLGADGRLCGDADAAAAEVVAAYTPVPGGVGAVTTAVLLRHVVEAAERRSAGGVG